MHPQKQQRQIKLRELLKKTPRVSQADILDAMVRAGFDTTQASVSRDLSELGAVKVQGAYRLPDLDSSQLQLVSELKVEAVGDHMVVIFVGRGHAPSAATVIDAAKIPGVVGTVAGDDTVFIAVRDAAQQRAAVRRIIALFKKPN